MTGDMEPGQRVRRGWRVWQEWSQRHLVWSSGQRSAIIVLGLILLVYLSIRFAVNPSYVPDPQPDEPARARELADRIDPNVADWETLAALPQLGERRARSIVEYRERFRSTRPDGNVFRSSQDLLRIRGIGASTIEQLHPFLTFPGTPSPSTTRPGASR